MGQKEMTMRGFESALTLSYLDVVIHRRVDPLMQGSTHRS